MATKAFPEKLSGFLRQRLDELKKKYGEDSRQYQGLARQYIRQDLESLETKEQNIKHYEAAVNVSLRGQELHGLERLYCRTLVIETTLACVAHCRYCLRSNYPKNTLTEKQLIDVAKYCGSPRTRDYLNEVLITGGDPLLMPHRLDILLDALIEHAPNIQMVRIATRITTQDPERVDNNVLRIFQNKPTLRFDLATQINHPVELCQKTEIAFRKIMDLGVKVYSQNVLLKGVNDDIDTLTELYNKMRVNNIEAHYLFHCVPMHGIHHLRTSIAKGLELIKALVCSGKISGRVKPMYAAMTDIGKITFYDGVIVDHKDGNVLLQSNYSLADRMAWNPSWQLPKTAEVDENGQLRVWYVDGEDS